MSGAGGAAGAPAVLVAPVFDGESGYVELTPDSEARAVAQELSSRAGGPLPDAAALDLASRTRVASAVLLPFSAQLPGRAAERSYLLYAGPRDPHAMELDPGYAVFSDVVRIGFKGGCGLDFIVVPIAKLLLFLLELSLLHDHLHIYDLPASSN